MAQRRDVGIAAGVEVASVRVADRHSGTTGRARLALDYASGSSGPDTVFVKLRPFEEAQRGLVAATDMGRREARFHAALSAETPMRLPVCHVAAWGDEPTDYICVFEDLEAAGCTFPESVEAHAREHGGALIEALEHVHAHFWEGDEGGSTLIHGDCHTGNQLLDGKQVGLYDWAVISRSPGIRDVAIFMGNACPPDVRRAEQDDWIRAYRRTLVDGGVDAPELDALWTQLRLGVLYGWVAATATASMGEMWQPLEVGWKAMRDATQACAELEALEAFREAL